MAAKDDRGRAGEDRAARHLLDAGWQVIDRNWRCPQGEIDILAWDGGTIVAVEVKTRRSERFGHPFAAIDARKRDRMWRVVAAWSAAHPDVARGRRVRIDVVGITGDDVATAAIEHLVDLR